MPRANFKLTLAPSGPTRIVAFVSHPSWDELVTHIISLFWFLVSGARIRLSYLDQDGGELSLSSSEELEQRYSEVLGRHVPKYTFHVEDSQLGSFTHTPMVQVGHFNTALEEAAPNGLTFPSLPTIQRVPPFDSEHFSLLGVGLREGCEGRRSRRELADHDYSRYLPNSSSNVGDRAIELLFTDPQEIAHDFCCCCGRSCGCGRNRGLGLGLGRGRERGHARRCGHGLQRGGFGWFQGPHGSPAPEFDDEYTYGPRFRPWDGQQDGDADSATLPGLSAPGDGHGEAQPGHRRPWDRGRERGLRWNFRGDG
jgi:hypothetical protein